MHEVVHLGSFDPLVHTLCPQKLHFAPQGGLKGAWKTWKSSRMPGKAPLGLHRLPGSSLGLGEPIPSLREPASTSRQVSSAPEASRLRLSTQNVNFVEKWKNSCWEGWGPLTQQPSPHGSLSRRDASPGLWGLLGSSSLCCFPPSCLSRGRKGHKDEVVPPTSESDSKVGETRASSA